MRYRMIRTENLTKYYRNRLGVKDLTLEVEPGEIFGFLGPTGAGKTTTILLLLDMIRSSSGPWSDTLWCRMLAWVQHPAWKALFSSG